MVMQPTFSFFLPGNGMCCVSAHLPCSRGLSAANVAAQAWLKGKSEPASVAPPLVASGHGEWQRNRGESGDLPVERPREEELVEDHHGDGLAEDHTNGHNLWREGCLALSGEWTQRKLLPSSRSGKLYHSKQGTGTSSVDPMLKCGRHACTHLFPLVLVEDDGREEEDGMAEKPQEASLHTIQWRVHTWAFHQQRGGSGTVSVIMQGASYFGEAEVEVPLKSASLSGDDLVKDRGQQ